MTHPAVAISATVLASLLLQSCSDGSTAPLTREITIRECSPNVVWAAYQNDGSKVWRRIDNPQAGVTLRVTPRLAIATYHPDDDDRGVYIDFLTAEQAEATYNCNGIGPAPTKTVHGSVLGLASGETAYITITGHDIEAPETNGPFTTKIIDGPVDLVATREPLSYTDRRISAIIIRRALNPAEGATLPALDFTSAEAFAPESTTATFSGIPSGWNAVANVEFSAAGNIGNPLSGTAITGSTATIYAVPSSKLESGDHYVLYAYAQAAGGTLSVMKFYSLASPDTVTFGPQLLEPVFTTVATTPNFRFRIDMPLQREYPAAITVSLSQRGTPSRNILMTASREYFGGSPQTWSVTVPDFSAADGFSSSWGLASDAFGWGATATSAPYGFSMYSDGRDGDVYRWVYRGGSH